ncbi:phosphoribosylglycinamide formyltransferase [Kangiella sediminilitoris]|uniref:Phosphoribosylglycinamide formyltransferase n=1 Tax=Kangiella sediminilitoris TaxID=1144748 RepID=A0A1B3BBH0_9GAMM|nr:phosphoribosylglycinamide formyltransferase [Kangiella sediminilitoris]AOE50122.1 Phosphoribosylglycinamide formyltransferase [Kangiella sediminilitoris]
MANTSIESSPARIVALISGSGSNLQALIDAAEMGAINGEIVAVISNNPDVQGLERADKAGIPSLVVDHRKFDDRQAFEAELSKSINHYSPDLIVLAGFMRILNSEFVQPYEGKMLNIHPSLLPKYKGLHTHRRALENGDKEHGVSVHFVTAELDGGPVIAQRKVKVEDSDTEESLQSKVRQKEHQLYPEVVAWFCSKRLQYKNGKALFDGQTL